MTAAETASEMTTTHQHQHHHHQYHQYSNNDTIGYLSNNSKNVNILDEKLNVTTTASIINNHSYLPSSPSFMCLTPTSNSSSASVNSNSNKPNDSHQSSVSSSQHQILRLDTIKHSALSTVQQSKQQVDKYEQFKLKRETDLFNQRLVEFHKHKNINTQLISWPTLNGKSLDLYKLYTKVVGLGGWERVCEKEKWPDVCSDLDEKLFQSCTMGSHALKLVYIRYLSSFEKVIQSLASSQPNINIYKPTQIESNTFNLYLNTLTASQISSLVNTNSIASSNHTTFNGLSIGSVPGLGYRRVNENLDDLNDDASLIANKRRFSYLLDSTQLSYNYMQHINEPLSLETIVTIEKPPSNHLPYNPYEKIEASLMSGLPNDVDFSFNTLLLLSSDENNLFRIYSSPRLIDLMLAHIGFFGISDKFNLGKLYANVWYPNVKIDANKNKQENLFNFYLSNGAIEKFAESKVPYRNFIQYWHNNVALGQDLTDYQRDLIKSLLPRLVNSFFELLPQQELLNLREKQHQTDLISNHTETSVEFRRIEQVMVIFNNLSFEESNADFMANKSPVLLEYLIMCMHCSNNGNSELKKHALDILVNLSRKLKLKKLAQIHQSLLLTTLTHLIMGDESFTMKTTLENKVMKSVSSDRFDLLRGLEILTKLCSQQISVSDLEDFSNENFLSQYELKISKKSDNLVPFLENLLSSIEQLLSMKDVLVILNSLECLYSLSQFSETICNLICNYTPSFSLIEKSNGNNKIVSFLIDLLTVDMSHFGSNLEPNCSSLKMYKMIPTNGLVISTNLTQDQNANNNQNKTSLLQQTLNNQHSILQNKSNCISTTINNNNSNNNKLVQNDQKAKDVLCNWLTTCFQAETKSELSKTQLYPYYQQIAKMNNWSVLPIPTFFDILNATYPNLRYDDNTNKIHGLKLVLNVKQQLQLKQQQQQFQQPQQSTNTTTSNITPTITTNNNLSSTVQNNTDKIVSSNLKDSALSPLPSVSIHIPTPNSIPLLTPPALVHPITNNSPVTNNDISTKVTEPTKKIDTKQLNGDIKQLNGENNHNEEIVNRIDAKIIENSKINKCTSITNGFDYSNNYNINTKSMECIDNKLTNGILNHNDENSSSSTYSTSSSSSSTNSTSSSLLITKADDLNEENLLKKRKKIEDETNNDEKENKSFDNSNSDKIKRLKENSGHNEIASNALCINSNNSNASIHNGNTTPEVTENNTNQAGFIPNPSTTLISALKSTNQMNGLVTQEDHFQQQQQHQVNEGGEYICEWNNCKRFFPTSKAVYNHVCKYHLLNNSEISSGSDGSLCMWSNCDQIRRQKWSLVNHLQEKHCNENAMKTAILLRKRGASININGYSNNSSTNSTLTMNKDAAFFAIKRHQVLHREDFMTFEEGPITKSIRLLAALVLRNLAKNSEKAKNSIKPYESVLTNVAFDLVESSNAIANCLWHLSH